MTDPDPGSRQTWETMNFSSHIASDKEKFPTQRTKGPRGPRLLVYNPQGHFILLGNTEISLSFKDKLGFQMSKTYLKIC